LIVVDDGSTDASRGVVEKYKSRIRYFYQQNRGVSAARNLGLAKATGEYLCFLDSDDLWLPNKLKIQLDFMESRPEYNICYTDEIWIRNGVRVNQKKRHRKYSGWILAHCLPLCIISPSSVMISRRLIDQSGGFDELLPACEDYDLWLRIAKDHPVYFIEQALIIKRGGHADQLSKKFVGLDRFRIAALEKLLNEGNLSPEQKILVERQLSIKCQIYAQGCSRRGRKSEGELYLSKIAYSEPVCPE
jgi:glycosyltransferase involved in cell wall biosynthesis